MINANRNIIFIEPSHCLAKEVAEMIRKDDAGSSGAIDWIKSMEPIMDRTYNTLPAGCSASDHLKLLHKYNLENINWKWYTVTRNPWARLVDTFVELSQNRYKDLGFMSFDKFCSVFWTQKTMFPQKYKLSQTKMQGDINYEFIGKSENIDDLAKYIINKHEINSDWFYPQSIASRIHENSRRKSVLSRGYQSFYTQDSLSLINEFWGDDIENLGYKYEEETINIDTENQILTSIEIEENEIKKALLNQHYSRIKKDD